VALDGAHPILVAECRAKEFQSRKSCLENRQGPLKQAVSATPPSVAIEALVLGGSGVFRALC